MSLGLISLLAVLLLLAAGLGWAGRTLLAPPQQEEAIPTYALAIVGQGTLGRNLNLAAQAQWSETAGLAGKLQGTLTSIPAGRQARINAGDVLYTVDLQPVYVLPGNVPAFRDMSRGLQGEDIAQLQSYLFESYGWALVPDGEFGESTEQLVKMWQKDHGLESTGVIPAGQILFAPHLPMTISWEDDIKVGSELQSGTKLLKIFGDTPAFSMSLPDGQLRAAHEGQSVELNYKGHTWMARIGTITENTEEHKLIAELLPSDGQESICGQHCDIIPATGLKGINASVVLIPEQSGIQVPVSAIRVDAQGKTVVVGRDGTQHPVTVLATVGGQAIVEGIEAGIQVRVWGEQKTNTPDQSPNSGNPGDSSPDAPSSENTQSGQ